MESLFRDLTFAFRSFRRRPRLALTLLLTLGLGIGLNAAMFSVLDAVLLRPLPYPDPDRLVTIEEQTRQTGPASRLTDPNFDDLARESRAFSAVAHYRGGSAPLSGGATPILADVEIVGGHFFEVLGHDPLLGRTFAEDEIAKGGPAASVLSYGFWQSYFGGDRDVIGKTLVAFGHPTRVVGVMPPGFQFPEGAQVWVNDGALPAGGSRTSHNLAGIGRLAAGISPGAAQAEVTGVALGIRREYPEVGEFFDFRLTDLHHDLVGDTRATVLLLSSSVALVLLIALVNLACLLLAQAVGRARELAVRRAVGADGRRLVRQTLTETTLLGLGGAGLGLALAWLTQGVLNRVLPDTLLHSGGVSLDWRVVTFTAAIGLLAGLGFGLAPALRAARVEPYDALRSERTLGAGSTRRRRTSLLVVPQYALSLATLIVALLVMTSLRRLDAVNNGMETDSLAVAELVLPSGDQSPYADSAAKVRFFDRVLDQVSLLPGVRAVTLDRTLPLAGVAYNQMVAAEGQDPIREMFPDNRAVGPRYFETTRIPIIVGRDFTDDDFRAGAHSVVVNQALAKILWGGTAEAVGKRMRRSWQDEYLTVVGVVADVRTKLDQPGRPGFYYPWNQLPAGEGMWVVAASSTPGSVLGPMRQALRSVAPDLPIGRVTTMASIRSDSIATPRLRAWLLAGFGILALLLAVLGVHGVLSYTVAQRRQEIAIRRAVGADRRDIEGLLGREGLVLVVGGQVFGVALALGFGRLLQSLVFGVSPREPAVYVAGSLVMAVTVLAACWLPARRAGRVDPIEALRAG